MCGIYGFLGRDAERPASREVLAAMHEVLVHRGPDGGGDHVDGSLGMGMCRLSIIDLATGDQPLANEDDSVWVVYNGEIYNFAELRSRLEAGGHRFATRSDTEVLVHLFEDRREALVDELRGMFGFAIWDARERRLLLGRDRLGIKPLYVAETPDGVVFGSELKAVVTSPWVRRELDPTALEAYLRWGYVPDPVSILAGVRKLSPGHTVWVENGRVATPKRYWTARAGFETPPPSGDDEEHAREIWRRLAESVESHLVADVEVGAFLSGGVDSSAVVTAMAEAAPGRIRTFSVGFEEPAFDERPYARAVAARLGTEHHEFVVGPESLDRLDDLLVGFDEPFADASAIPTYLVSRLAAEFVKVVLSGDGGDELFAGYDRYIVDHRRRHLGRIGDLGLGAPLRFLSDRLPEGTPGKRYLRNLSLPRIERYLDSIAFFPTQEIDTLLPDRPTAPDPFLAWADRGRGLPALSHLQMLDLETYLPGDILTKVDRASMASSIESRVPLLDHRFVEFACSLPVGSRLDARGGKRLFKRALRGHVPDEILDRPKQGFAVPLEAWFAGRLSGYLRDHLGPGSPLERIGIEPAAVARLLDLHESLGREDHCRRLWALLVLARSVDRLGITRA